MIEDCAACIDDNDEQLISMVSCLKKLNLHMMLCIRPLIRLQSPPHHSTRVFFSPLVNIVIVSIMVAGRRG